MKPGKLKERMVVQKKMRTPNHSGGNQTFWEDAFETWAAVTTFDPTQLEQAGQDMRRSPYRVVIRESAVTADHRMIWRGLVLEIDYVEEYITGPPYYRILHCRELRTI